MADRRMTSSSVKIWRHNNLSTAPIPIDPDGPKDADGNLTGYPCKRILIKPGVSNQGVIRVHEQQGSNVHYYELAGGELPMELWINNTLLVTLSASAAGNTVYVYIERQAGESQ